MDLAKILASAAALHGFGSYCELRKGIDVILIERNRLIECAQRGGRIPTLQLCHAQLIGGTRLRFGTRLGRTDSRGRCAACQDDEQTMTTPHVQPPQENRKGAGGSEFHPMRTSKGRPVNVMVFAAFSPATRTWMVRLAGGSMREPRASCPAYLESSWF
jgi:hypothetical protein